MNGQTLVKEISVHVFFFSLELLIQQELGCGREPAYLHHLLSIPTLRTTFGHFRQQLAVVAICLDRTLILKPHEWLGGTKAKVEGSGRQRF